MIFNTTGLTTGMLSYRLSKEFYGQAAIPTRELETFTYEIYSSDLSGLSPTTIQNNIQSQFTGYSGNVNVKVLQAPGDYFFPNDSIRTAKFNVNVELRRIPSNISGYSELNTPYYTGFGPNFFIANANNIINLKESFNFQQGQNGHQNFEHSFSFELISGGRPAAAAIASGLFSTDDATTFGISVFQNGITGANTANVQNYFTESYDLIKNVYSFSKKRDFYPDDAGTYNYNLVNTFNLKENGIFDVSEKCELQGKISFSQAQNGLNIIYAGAYTRCQELYEVYQDAIGGFNSISDLSILPSKIIKEYNIPELLATYNVTYTNNPLYQNNASIVEEIIELDVTKRNVVSITDHYNILFNRRDINSVSPHILIQIAAAESPIIAQTYYSTSYLYNSLWPLNQIKYNLTWPSYAGNKATFNASYNNNPIYFVNVNGVNFNSLEYKIENTQPVSIVTEYKVIDRPNKMSVLSYAFQNEKGQVSINFTADIGRLTNEWSTGFRQDVPQFTYALYLYAIELFLAQFNNMIPLSFNYYLDNISYSFNEEGILSFNTSFVYTLKKFI